MMDNCYSAPVFQRIYGCVQKRAYRLKKRKERGKPLRESEYIFLSKKLIDLARAEYNILKQSLEHSTKQTDRFSGVSALTHGKATPSTETYLMSMNSQGKIFLHHLPSERQENIWSNLI